MDRICIRDIDTKYGHSEGGGGIVCVNICTCTVWVWTFVIGKGSDEPQLLTN